MDEAEFKQAIRLLHVTRAWAGTPNASPDPAREDPLYPGKHQSLQQRPLLTAISELLERYPYEPDTHAPSSHSGPESAARSQPSGHPVD